MRPDESLVGQPVRSLQTMLRVLAEDDSSLPTVIPDGIYGQDTMRAVSAFQRRQGIPVTGVVDLNTWEQIVESYELAIIRVDKAEPIEVLINANEVYRLGDSGPYIYLLQSMLTQLAQDHKSIPPLQLTGIVDAETSAALVAFQQLADLPANGELDKITWKYVVRHFVANAHHSKAQHIRTESL